MNKKGQTLIIFVILIPMFLGIVALVVDTGMIVYEKTHGIELAKTIIRDSMNKSEDDILALCRNNNVNEENLKINSSEDKITIQNEYEIDSIFGSVIGIKKYKIKINVTGVNKENKIKFE